MLTVILIGGKSSRMGRDKALLPLEGATFLSHLIKKYGEALGPVAVCVDKSGRFEHAGAIELVDSYPGKGPMNGLYSAFSQTDAQSVFMTATDLPYGDPALVSYLAQRLGSYDACVIRRADGNVEPLFAVYARSCFDKVRAFLARDRRALNALVRELDVKTVDEAELTSRRDLDRVLMNVNTPEDYQAIQGLNR